MIKAIFYSRFDTQEGPKVVHQVPDGAIVPSPTASPQQAPFFLFPDISFFVIPRQELCGNLLQVCTSGYRILGYPICMKSPQYDRNEFIFNFCFVLAEEEDFSKYKSIVQKLADLMHGLEEQSCFLSRDHSKSGEGKVYSLCETLMEDLNSYSECMIPIDKLNTLNFKLFPVYPAPPYVKARDVPLFTVRFETFLDESWDLTLQKIVPYINGINSVRIISILADVELSLAYRAIRHLLYYGCVFLLDIFSFSAIYAPTANFNSSIASDEGMQQECARYVNTRFAPSALQVAPEPSSGTATPSDFRGDFPDTSHSRFGYMDDNIWPIIGDADTDNDGDYEEEDDEEDDDHDDDHNKTNIKNDEEDDDDDDDDFDDDDTNGFHPSQTQRQRQPRQKSRRKYLDGVGIIELYASLRQGQSVKQWYNQHSQQLANVDIRRFITFGIIKGFLYRVHKYVYGPRPEGFKYTSSTSSHADMKSLARKAAASAASSRGASSSGLGSSMNSGGRGTTTSTTAAGDDAGVLSRESSIRFRREESQTPGGTSGSYQSANHDNHNIRLGSSFPLSPTTYEGNDDDGNNSDEHDPEEEGGEGEEQERNRNEDDDPDPDNDDDNRRDGEDKEGGTAQEAIRFHQNHKALEKYLDGQHCFDEICTDLEISERELMARLRRIPWVVHIIHR